MIDFTINPNWLTSTVVALAQQMCNTKNYDALPILADALQDAECNHTPLLNYLRDAKYPKQWLAHLIANEMTSAPLPPNPVDQGELFVFLKNTQFLSYLAIAERFKIHCTQPRTRQHPPPRPRPNSQYVRMRSMIWSPRVHHTDRQKVREGKQTVAWLVKKLSHTLNDAAQTN